jgi:mycobactin peptide synthetase MbtE
VPKPVSRGPLCRYAAGATLHEAFLRHAARQPGALSVIDGERRLSYATVEAASRRYAARLARLGVRPGGFVPLGCPRSAEFVAVALAVLRLGAAYAGIDPRWPPARVATVLGQLAAPVLVTGPGRRPDPPCDVTVWAPDEPVERAAQLAPESVADHVGSGAQVCSVYFTSGSTGTPKAVLARHRGVLRLMETPAFGPFGPGLVMPIAASPAWDGFSMELWCAQATGGTSVAVREPYLDQTTLRRAIADHGVNTAFLTTSLFAMVVDEDPRAFAGLRHTVVGGETLSPSHARRFLDHNPGCRLTNGYGLAETGIVSTVHNVTPADCERPEGIPVGRPVADTELYIMDGEEPVGPGQAGELCIGGDGLAAGYLGDAELTGRRFVGLDSGAGVRRVYRTGDLVRWSADGVLLIQGRVDRQVKIRGFRVEPEEVERAMRRQPGVLLAVAVPRPDPAGGYRDLVACYTAAAGGPGPDPAELTERLRAALPSYVVPAVVRRIDRFPLLPNGKVDTDEVLARLVEAGTPEARGPSAGAAAAGAAAAGAAAAGAAAAGARLEAAPAANGAVAVVAEVFAEVLNRSPVPADVSAFELGATSLDAGRICARLGQRLATAVPVSRFMANASVRAIADWLDRNREAPGPPAEPPTPGPVPLTAAQTGFWLAHVLAPDDLAAHCTVVFDIEGPVDPAVLERALQDVQDRHESLRAVYGADAAPTATVTRGTAVRLTHHHGRDAMLAALARPFSLAEGRVWRAAFTADPAGGALGVAVHHVAFDGWSEAVFARDLGLAYTARLAGRAPAFDRTAPGLAALSAGWRRRQANADLAGQRQFWRGYLADLPELRFPGPQPAGAVDRPHSGGLVTLSNTVHVAPEALARVARTHGLTPFAMVAAAYAEAVATVTGQHDFGIGVPVAQRDIPGAADAIGCLLATLCLRVPAGTGDPVATAVEAAASITAAFAAQDIPFDEVVRLLGPARGDRNPLFQAMLVLQDTDPTVLELPGCRVRVHRPAPFGPMFDVVTEIRPARDATVDVQVHADPRRVTAATARGLLDAFAGMLRRITGARTMATRR